MSIFTSGRVIAKPFRIFIDGDLQDLLTQVQADLYVYDTTQPSEGWGRFIEDDGVYANPSSHAFTATAPSITPAGRDLPARMRVRFYYDEPRTAVRRVLPLGTPWGQYHVREAFDVIVFDGDPQEGLTALCSTRDPKTVRNKVVPSLDNLAHAFQGRTEWNNLPEFIDAEFFKWIFFKLGDNPTLDPNIFLTEIREVKSQDLVGGSARFSDGAHSERVEVASLLAGQNASFGPAKLCLQTTVPDAYYDMELDTMGGFSMFAGSGYEIDNDANNGLGRIDLMEDLWLKVLPVLRQSFVNDQDWVTRGRTQLRDDALHLLRTHFSI
ncbi:hypothetical protein [Kocuria rosea]|uniref:hypothetical protein n=1 Tax=Kocuria rosea TaxID=1275 RepID=UPI00119CCEE6|nr:hypothetical protein [Kocuria rosea]